MATGGVKEVDLLSDETFDLLCSVCRKKNKNTEAAKFCVDCQDYYCSTCVKFHDDIPALSRHKILDEGQYQPGTNQELQMVPNEHCARHSHKHIDMYCQNHDDVGCTTCMAVDHRSCRDIFYIPDFIQSNVDTSNPHAIHRELNSSTDMLEDQYNKVQLEKERLLKSKAQSRMKINQFRAVINQRLDLLKQKSMVDIEDKYKPMLDKLDKHIDTIEINKVKVSTAKDNLAFAGNNVSLAFVSTKKCKIAADNALKCVDEIKAEIMGEDKQFIPDRKLTTLLKELNLLGQLTETDTGRDHQTETNTGRDHQTETDTGRDHHTETNTGTDHQAKTDTGTDHQTKTDTVRDYQTDRETGRDYQNQMVPVVKSRENSGNQTGKASSDDCKSLIKVKGKKQYNIRIPDDVVSCNIFGACILDDGTIILADYDNSNLKRVDSSTYTVTDYCDVSGGLFQVCKISKQEVAVSCGGHNYIQFVSIGNKMVPTKQIKTDHRCGGLAYAAGHVYISDNTSVYIYTVSGSRLQQFNKDQSGQGLLFSIYSLAVEQFYKNQSGMTLFSDIYSLAVSNDGSKIYVADANNGLIALDSNGKVLGKFNDAELKHAQGICIMDTGSVFVCGYGSKNVLQFTPDCEKIGEVLKCDAGYRAICYDPRQSKLVLGCHNMNTIDMYDVN